MKHLSSQYKLLVAELLIWNSDSTGQVLPPRNCSKTLVIEWRLKLGYNPCLRQWWHQLSDLPPTTLISRASCGNGTTSSRFLPFLLATTSSHSHLRLGTQRRMPQSREAEHWKWTKITPSHSVCHMLESLNHVKSTGCFTSSMQSLMFRCSRHKFPPLEKSTAPWGAVGQNEERLLEAVISRFSRCPFVFYSCHEWCASCALLKRHPAWKYS